MLYKKTWFSYILWAAFVCTAGIMLANYTVLFWKIQISPDTGIYTVGFIFLVFAFAAGLYFLLRKTVAEILSKHRINEHAALMWEIFVVLYIFCIALLYRFYLCLQNGAELAVETEFYHMAIVREAMGAESVVHGASYLYVQFLSLVFSFLGNKLMAAVWMQIFIEMLTILLAYFAIRKILGRIPACVVMLTMSVSSIYIKQIFALTPEVMFFFLYLLGLFITGSYVKAYCDNRLGTNMALLGAVFSGIVIGILIYLDAFSITLFIILAGLVTGIHKQTGIAVKKELSVLFLLLSLITCTLSMSGAFALDSYMSGDSIEVVSLAWLNLYSIPDLSRLSINAVLYRNNYALIECFIQLILAALLIPAFWNRQKSQNFTPWFALMLIMLPITFSGAGVLSYQIFSVFLWSVLAGAGLQQSLIIEEAAAEPMVTADSFKAMDNVESMNAVKSINYIEGINAEEDLKTMPLKPMPSAPEPRYIENPLPLPKKHEKKEMDYQYEVAEDKMEFDIEIMDDDDFDRYK